MRRAVTADGAALRAPGPAGDAARREALRGSRIAILSAGYPTKRYLYERAAGLGVDLVFVDEPGHWSEGLVGDGIASAFVPVSWSGHPDEDAETALRALGRAGRELDGVVTFWENTVPAVARVAETLRLPGFSPHAADTARCKINTLDASEHGGLPTPRHEPISSPADLVPAAGRVGFPAVLKPAFGAEALGCIRVDDLAALLSAYERVHAIADPSVDDIFLMGTDLVLEEYLDGAEFDVDVVLSEGACVFATVSENWPTDEPYFVETGMHTPTDHPEPRQAALIDLCVRTALALGFRDGALHIEAKDTTRGPRILEVNARLGGGRIPDFHRIVTGVDLLEQVMLVTAGIPVVPTRHETGRGVAAAFVSAPRTGVLGRDDFLEGLAAEPDVLQAEVVAHPGETVTSHHDGFPTPVAEIAVVADSAPAAVARVRGIVAALEIPIGSPGP